jgi:hypothetical protein
MKENQSNKKKYIMIFLIAFAIPIAYQLFKHFNFFKPSYTQTYNPKEEIIIEKGFSKNGCYELGLWSSDGDLHYRMHDGKFEIAYYHDNTLLKKKILTKDNQSGYSMKGGVGSHIALDTVEIPYNGKYSKLKIIFKTLKEDSVASQNDNIEFYINKSQYVCGKEAEYYENNKAFPITKNETNETLKPLFLALVKKDTQKVKEIIEGGISPNVIMIGKRRPIHYSAFVNDSKTMQYLIDKKVDLNKKDLLNYTPLHFAIENNATKTVKMLLENGADLNLVKKVTTRYIDRAYYQTHPTQVAKPIRIMNFLILYNLVELSEILLEAGLNPNEIPKKIKATPYGNLYRNTRYRDYNDRSPYAGGPFDHNYTNMVRILEKYGAKTYDELQQEKNKTKGNK